MGDRRKARELALQMLFQDEFNREATQEVPLPLTSSSRQTSQHDFARQIIEGTRKHRSEIDALIVSHTEHWSSERLAAVDHNILRVALFEMIFLKETPPKVIINEAIDIARKYGSEQSGSFVNGVLDAVFRQFSTHMESKMEQVAQ